MQKLLVPLAALDRILLRVREMMADLKRDPTDKEKSMVEWLERIIAADPNPIANLIRQVGSLRSGWNRPLTAMEMHELHGSQDCLMDFTTREWDTIREFLAYHPKTYEKLYQVRNLQWFLQAPSDTLNAAETWKQANLPKRVQKPVNTSAGDILSKEEMLKILRGEEV